MKKHTKVFTNFWDDALIIYQSPQCFMCAKYVAVDIHHIQGRGMGGSKCKDYIENLAALCRSCHTKSNDKEFNKRVRIETLKRIAEKLENELGQ